MSIERSNAEAVRRVHAFVTGDEERPLAFAQRLMEHTGWPALHTLRVIEEYRRFLVVAAVGEHPVSPSKAVDEAWHLHLLFTRNYWLGLCAGVLGRALHHDPDTGREGQADLYRNWYRRTLETYAKVYGERPPSDIWPGAERLDYSSPAAQSEPTTSPKQAHPAGRREVTAAWLLASGLLSGCTPATTLGTLSAAGWIMLGLAGTLGPLLIALLVALARASSRAKPDDAASAATGSRDSGGVEAFPWWIMAPTGGGSATGHHPHGPASSHHVHPHHTHPHAGQHEATGHGDSSGQTGDTGSGDSGGGGDGGGGGCSDGGAGCGGDGCGGS